MYGAQVQYYMPNFIWNGSESAFLIKLSCCIRISILRLCLDLTFHSSKKIQDISKLGSKSSQVCAKTVYRHNITSARNLSGLKMKANGTFQRIRFSRSFPCNLPLTFVHNEIRVPRWQTSGLCKSFPDHAFCQTMLDFFTFEEKVFRVLVLGKR